MNEHWPSKRERVVARLRRDAESAARAGDISIRERSWGAANAAYRLACDLNTAARQVELNLHIAPSYQTLVQKARDEED